MSQTLFDYYTSVPGFYQPLLHAITLSNTVITALAVWIIVVHSPPSMVVYKWFLLNLAVSHSHITRMHKCLVLVETNEYELLCWCECS